MKICNCSVGEKCAVPRVCPPLLGCAISPMNPSGIREPGCDILQLSPARHCFVSALSPNTYFGFLNKNFEDEKRFHMSSFYFFCKIGVNSRKLVTEKCKNANFSSAYLKFVHLKRSNSRHCILFQVLKVRIQNCAAEAIFCCKVNRSLFGRCCI
jgi:hypothetical protein